MKEINNHIYKNSESGNNYSKDDALNNLKNELLIAIAEENLDKINLLLKTEVSKRESNVVRDFINNAFHFAAEKGHHKVVNFLLTIATNDQKQAIIAFKEFKIFAHIIRNQWLDLADEIWEVTNNDAHNVMVKSYIKDLKLKPLIDEERKQFYLLVKFLNKKMRLVLLEMFSIL